MRKVLSLLLTLSLVLSSLFVSFASNNDTVSNGAKEILVFQNNEIKDKEVLFDRAMNNISDMKNDKFEIRDLDNVKVLNSYHTTQLLEKKIVDGSTIENYAATSILEIEPVAPTNSSGTKLDSKLTGSSATKLNTILAGPREKKTYDVQIFGDKSVGDGTDTAGSHVYLYNTIYYTLGQTTDMTGDLVDVATFTKAVVSLDLNDSVNVNSGSYTLKEVGYLITDRLLSAKSKKVNISATVSDVTYGPTRTNFPAMYNTQFYDEPYYTVKTVLNWTRGGSTGTSSCTYFYEVGQSDGWE